LICERAGKDDPEPNPNAKRQGVVAIMRARVAYVNVMPAILRARYGWCTAGIDGSSRDGEK